MPDDVTQEAESPYTRRQQRALTGIKRREEALGALSDVFGREGGRRSNQLNRQINRSRRRFGLEGVDSGARDASELGLQDINALQGLIRPREGRGQGLNRASVFSKQAELGLADRRQRESQQYLDETVQPQIDAINERIQQMLAEPSVDAYERSALRSQAIDVTRRQETDRQKRLQSLFGAAGYSAGSPVAQVLANRTAQDADARLASMFQELDLEISRRRQQESLTELGLASNLNTQTLAARQAATTGDFDRLLGIQSELGGLFEGIQQQQEAIDAARAEARDADKKSAFDYINEGIGVLTGVGSIVSGLNGMGAFGKSGLFGNGVGVGTG